MVSWTSANKWEEGIIEECLLYALELCCNGKIDKNETINPSLNVVLLQSGTCFCQNLHVVHIILFWTLETNYLLNVSQRPGVPAQLLPLLLKVEAGVRARMGINLYRWHATQWAERGIKDHLVVSDQELNNQCLIRVIHQRGKGNFGICLPWFDQCWTKNDAQVAGCHLILFWLLCHAARWKVIA